MNKLYLVLVSLVVFGGSLGGAFVLADHFRTVERERRFMDECQFAPAVPQADGSIPARVARLPFPTCWIELTKAKTVTTIVTLATQAPPAPSPAPPAPSKGSK